MESSGGLGGFSLDATCTVHRAQCIAARNPRLSQGSFAGSASQSESKSFARRVANTFLLAASKWLSIIRPVLIMQLILNSKTISHQGWSLTLKA